MSNECRKCGERITERAAWPLGPHRWYAFAPDMGIEWPFCDETGDHEPTESPS